MRNLTATSGVRESDAVWSKDGQRIAYLSDEGGTQALFVRDAIGLEKPIRRHLGKHGLFHLARLVARCPPCRVSRQPLYVSMQSISSADAVELIDASPRRLLVPVSFSPDGQWIAYTLVGENYFTRVRLHSFAGAKSFELADSFVQTDSPVFGGNDLLYFTASIDAGPTRESPRHVNSRAAAAHGLYAAVLSADGHSPLPPKSGDEDAKEGKNKDADKV